MTSLLLAIIYLTFISLGLPDGLLGAAWPVMHTDLGAPVAAQSAISIIISGCTIISSLLTARLVARLGTGKLCTVSVALTAIAVIGFSHVTAFWQLCLLAIPYGLGAGAIDAALNNYAALNYGARHMSWLHCCWGIGASAGPVVMGWALGSAYGWPAGYLIIGAAQVIITFALLMSLPLWKREQSVDDQDHSDNSKEAAGTEVVPPSNRELLRLPGAKETIASFGCYCALEGATGLWTASYLVIVRGIQADTAASIVSLFYIGITIGRLLAGFASGMLDSAQQIRVGQTLAAAGILCLILSPIDALLWVAVGLIGLGAAPIYPGIVALTPRRFGRRASQGLVSLQMACAYIGYTVAPPVFGLVANGGKASAIPFLLLVLLVANIVLAERAATKTAGRQ